MAIPPIRKRFASLPPGEHLTSLKEITERFGSSSPRRVELMAGLLKAVENFRDAKVPKIWIDGSFVSNMKYPNDIDGCWAFTKNVDLSKLDRCFVNTDRNDMKHRFGLDFFPSNLIEGESAKPFPYFFQFSKDGNTKGILVVDLKGNKDD